MHPEFPPVAFVSAILVLVVLPWHWRTKNVAALTLSLWLFTANVIYGVDAMVWGDNASVVIPVWCDITTKLLVGTNFALPSACLCICIHLEQVAALRFARTSQSDKRRRQIFEALMCFGLPLLFMGLHFIVQGHRFDIIEEYGCRPTTYFSVPALFIVWIPPLILSLFSLVFASLALRHFILCRNSFAAHLTASQSALNTSEYVRLMLMTSFLMFWSLSTTAYGLWFNFMATPLRPWTTWDDVHSNFGRADTYATVFTPLPILTGYYVLWWMVPISTIIFVVFFAFGRDAMQEYKQCFRWVRSRVLRRSPSSESCSKNDFPSLLETRCAQRIPVSLKSAPTPTTSSISSYKGPTPPSPNKYRSKLDDVDYGVQSSCLGPELTIPRPTLQRPFTYPSHDPSHRAITNFIT